MMLSRFEAAWPIAACALGALLLSATMVMPAAAQDTTRAIIEPDTLKAPAEPVVDQNLARYRTGLARLDQLTKELDELIGERKTDLDEQALARVSGAALFEESVGLIKDLSNRLGRVEADSTVADSLRDATVDLCRRQLNLQLATVDGLYDSVEAKWAQRADMPLEEIREFESKIDEEWSLADMAAGWFLDTGGVGEKLGMDLEDVWSKFDPMLKENADMVVGRVRLAKIEQTRLQAQLSVGVKAGSGEQEVAALRVRVQAGEQRLKSNVDGLRRQIRHLEIRGFDVTQYRTVVIEATGELGEDLLDPEVLKALLVATWNSITDWLGENGPTMLVRLLILFVVIMIFRWTTRLIWFFVLVTRVQRKSRLLRDTVGRMVMPVATMVGVLAGLWLLGVHPTTLLTGVGVASVILGLALQDSLANLAAGAFILLYRPYDVDDVVQAGGIVGNVKAMGLANTTIVTFDNRRMFVPNRKIWSEVVENRSMEYRRRVETVVRVMYGEDVDRVIKLIHAELAECPLVLEDPEPPAFVAKLDDSWIEINVWAWAKLEDWWDLTITLPHMMLRMLQREEIRVPWERREIALLQRDPEEAPPTELP